MRYFAPRWAPRHRGYWYCVDTTWVLLELCWHRNGTTLARRWNYTGTIVVLRSNSSGTPLGLH